MQNIVEICETLYSTYKDAKTELKFKNETELAVAVMLSAQTTDKKVNQITESLFKKYKSWEDYAKSDLKTLQNDIHGVNFHLGKADRLIKAGKTVISSFGGVLPKTLAELITIPGIARKSANVILQELWGIAEGIVVDTHISRVSNRLGLTVNSDPKKIENDLMKIVPKKYWKLYSQAVVLHGRYICIARKPKCEDCILKDFCPSAFKN